VGLAGRGLSGRISPFVGAYQRPPGDDAPLVHKARGGDSSRGDAASGPSDLVPVAGGNSRSFGSGPRRGVDWIWRARTVDRTVDGREFGGLGEAGALLLVRWSAAVLGRGEPGKEVNGVGKRSRRSARFKAAEMKSGLALDMVEAPNASRACRGKRRRCRIRVLN
jgi:hypothetical protein